MTHEDRIAKMVVEMSEEDVRTELAYLMVLQSFNKQNEIKRNLDGLLKRIIYKNI